MRATPYIGGAGSRRAARLARRVVRRFFAQGMTVYAAALAYRGLLALVPFALIVLSLIGFFDLEGSLPRLTGFLRGLRGLRGDDGAAADVPLEGLFSFGAIVGVWSMSAGARLFMRALNTVHGVEEGRTPLARAAFSVVFLPGLAAVTVGATVLLLTTTRVLAWLAAWAGIEPALAALGVWLRTPIALALIAGAVAAGAAVAVVLWAAASFAFGFALSTFLDYGSTYGGLGAGVALLVYLHISAVVLLLGAQVSAVLGGAARARRARNRACRAWRLR